MSIDVGGWDFSNFGGPGYGTVDMQKARELGASHYQLAQLAEEATKRGLHIGADARAMAASAPKAPWNYGAVGAYGFGMADVNAVNDLDKVTQYVNWGQQQNLPIGQGVREWITEKQIEKQDARSEQMMNNWTEAYKAVNPPTVAPGNPSLVGKQGELARQSESRSSSRRRDLKSLRRPRSSNYSNKLGGMSPRPSLNIA